MWLCPLHFFVVQYLLQTNFTRTFCRGTYNVFITTFYSLGHFTCTLASVFLELLVEIGEAYILNEDGVMQFQQY